MLHAQRITCDITVELLLLQLLKADAAMTRSISPVFVFTCRCWQHKKSGKTHPQKDQQSGPYGAITLPPLFFQGQAEREAPGKAYDN